MPYVFAPEPRGTGRTESLLFEKKQDMKCPEDMQSDGFCPFCVPACPVITISKTILHQSAYRVKE